MAASSTEGKPTPSIPKRGRNGCIREARARGMRALKQKKKKNVSDGISDRSEGRLRGIITGVRLLLGRGRLIGGWSLLFYLFACKIVFLRLKKWSLSNDSD